MPPATRRSTWSRTCVKKLPVVDPDRVYVIGYSMGGFGTWHFLKEEPRLFAAGIPIAGGIRAASASCARCRSGPSTARRTRSSTVDGARACAEELKRSKVFKYTEFPDDGHGIAGKVVDDEAVHEWLFEQKR